MSFLYYAKRILTPRKCVSCRGILSLDSFDDAFCPTCMLHWRAAQTESCPECFGAASECSCMPSQLSRAGALTLRRLFFYNPKRDTEAQNRLVYYLKHHKSKRAADFVARELCRAVNEELDTLGVNPREALVVNVPRGRRAVNEYGFDQSAEVCRALAGRLGAEYCSAVSRRAGGREQKKLNAKERRNNIKKLMRVKKRDGERVRGRYVVLFDDVVTTGASMAVCTELLRRSGAKGVLCFSTASDLKKEINPQR